MGSACSRSADRNVLPSLDQPMVLGHQRVTQPQTVVRMASGNQPQPLLELCVRSVCEKIEAFPALKLPPELAQRVFNYLTSRGWLSIDSLLQLGGCRLYSLELPYFAPLSESGGGTWFPLIARHTEAVRLDIAGAHGMTDSTFRRVQSLSSLTALNISGCASLTDAALVHVGQLARLAIVKMESLPRLTNEALTHLRPLRELLWLSTAGPVTDTFHVDACTVWV